MPPLQAQIYPRVVPLMTDVLRSSLSIALTGISMRSHGPGAASGPAAPTKPTKLAVLKRVGLAAVNTMLNLLSEPGARKAMVEVRVGAGPCEVVGGGVILMWGGGGCVA